MKYSLEIRQKEQYISVVTEGDLTARNIGDMGRDFVQKEVETGIRKVLLDIRKSRVKAGFLDAFTYTTSSKIPILPGEKNAILVDPKSPDLLKIRIYMLQSTACGLHVRKFTDEKEALEWLLG
ncbi:MAG TPA: hypothetical protein P5511_03160 [Candidatus Goldiibacteriota bacterium]|nr:hypothetical protein [Candidatus Goldiibacteriota bacterium]